MRLISFSAVIICVLLIRDDVSCSNILIVSDMLSPSHKIWNFAVAEGLLQKGHNVTMLAPKLLTKLGKQYENFHDIYLEGVIEKVLTEDFKLSEILASSIVSNMFWFYDYCISACQYSLQTDGLQNLLEYPKNFKFNAIIFDITTSPCLLPLMKRFNYPPSMAMTAFLLPHYLSQQFGNDINPSYVPSFLVNYSSDMTFLERLQHYVWIHLDLLLRKVYLKSRVEELMRQKFGENIESVKEMEDRLSLLLSNISPYFHDPQPLTPNIIPVGGLHIKPAKKLPDDLQNILDTAKNGVILFALGSNVRSDSLGKEKIKALLEAFSKIEQTVIWKFETNLTEYTVPKNVIIRNWLPQNDMLAHQNIRLFINHAGGLSTLEATYHGVPILGIPFFVDQHQNIRMMEKKKLAIGMEFELLTDSNYILKNIQKMLANKEFSKNVKQVSIRMKDQPQTPLERAIFWIEYTMRHQETHFLDTKSRELPLFVSSSMDVILFILIVLLLVIWILKKIISMILRNNNSKIKHKTQ